MTEQAAGAPAKRHPTAGKASAKPPRAAPAYTLAATVAAPSQLSTRTIVRVFFTLVALGVLLYVLYLVRSVIGLLLIAVFLAVALGPAVDRFRDARLPRAAAILAVFLALFLAIFRDRPRSSCRRSSTRSTASPTTSPATSTTCATTTRSASTTTSTTSRRSSRSRPEPLPSRLGDAAGALQAITVGVFTTRHPAGHGPDDDVLPAARRPADRRLPARAAAPASSEARVRGDGRGHLQRRPAATSPAPADSPRSPAISTYIVLTMLGVPFAVPLAVLMAFFDLIPLVGATIGGVLVALVDAVRRLPERHDHLGRLLRPLPAVREQRPAAAGLPPDGQPAPARGDHRDPDRRDRCSACSARSSRSRSPRRSRSRSRTSGPTAPPRSSTRPARRWSPPRAATCRRARSSYRLRRGPQTKT